WRALPARPMPSAAWALPSSAFSTAAYLIVSVESEAFCFRLETTSLAAAIVGEEGVLVGAEVVFMAAFRVCAVKVLHRIERENQARVPCVHRRAAHGRESATPSARPRLSPVPPR